VCIVKCPKNMTSYKTGNLRITWHLGALVQPMLLCKSSGYYILWVCVCSLGTHHAMRMRHIAICGLSDCTIFLVFTNTPRFSKKEVTERKICVVVFLELLSETSLIVRRNERDVIKRYIGLHVKYPLFLSHFNETWIFSADFRKTLKYQI